MNRIRAISRNCDECEEANADEQHQAMDQFCRRCCHCRGAFVHLFRANICLKIFLISRARKTKDDGWRAKKVFGACHLTNAQFGGCLRKSGPNWAKSGNVA